MGIFSRLKTLDSYFLRAIRRTDGVWQACIDLEEGKKERGRECLLAYAFGKVEERGTAPRGHDPYRGDTAPF